MSVFTNKLRAFFHVCLSVERINLHGVQVFDEVALVTVYVLNVVSCYVSHFMIKFANRGAFKDKARAAQAKAATFDFLGTKQPEGFKLHRGLKHRSVRFDHIVKEKNV